MPAGGQGIPEGIRNARDVAADPSGVVILWKAATGGKAAGCLTPVPAPEILHAADLLPISLESAKEYSLLSCHMDAWLIGTEPARFRIQDAATPRFTQPCAKPANLEEALDRLESLAEWSFNVSGVPASEGALWKSVRGYAIRRTLLDALEDRCAREPAFLAEDERRDLLRVGSFLPPESHSCLLASVLGIDVERVSIPGELGKGDPMLLLARRIVE